MNTVQKFEADQLAKLTEGKAPIPEFGPGDTLKVSIKIVEGERERIQAYEGVCISRMGTNINAKFTVRKISYGEGVERVFPLFSPRIEKIEVVRKGKVRRAKLYYLRGLRGKSARITEKTEARVMDENQLTATQKSAAKKAAKAEKKAAPKIEKTSKASKVKAAAAAEAAAAEAAKTAE